MMTADGWRTAGVAALWGTACLGVLRLQELTYDFGHGICGVWGCGPPVQALLACHGFWVVNLAALLWVNHAWFPLPWERRLANVALVIGLLGFAAVAGHTMFFWYPFVSDEVRPYVVRRFLFSIATLVDAPLVQLALVGIAGRWLARRRAESESALLRVCSAFEDSRTMTEAAHRDEVAVG